MTAQLLLSIDGTPYQVQCKPPILSVRLISPRGESYTVQARGGRVACSCGDYVHRQAGTTAGRCKHGEACVRAGLLSPHVPGEHEPDDSQFLRPNPAGTQA